MLAKCLPLALEPLPAGRTPLACSILRVRGGGLGLELFFLKTVLVLLDVPKDISRHVCLCDLNVSQPRPIGTEVEVSKISRPHTSGARPLPGLRDHASPPSPQRTNDPFFVVDVVVRASASLSSIVIGRSLSIKRPSGPTGGHTFS